VVNGRERCVREEGIVIVESGDVGESRLGLRGFDLGFSPKFLEFSSRFKFKKNNTTSEKFLGPPLEKTVRGF
jgi:hypothetical protein